MPVNISTPRASLSSAFLLFATAAACNPNNRKHISFTAINFPTFTTASILLDCKCFSWFSFYNNKKASRVFGVKKAPKKPDWCYDHRSEFICFSEKRFECIHCTNTLGSILSGTSSSPGHDFTLTARGRGAYWVIAVDSFKVPSLDHELQSLNRCRYFWWARAISSDDITASKYQTSNHCLYLD